MAEKYLVIVESPTKAKTIRKFLPKSYIVEASMGHLRDLPKSATEIPAKYKKEEWSKLGVNVKENFEPLYVVPKGKSKIVRELKKKLKEASVLYLATDEDREGESISWHLIELLKPKVPVKRMVFHEITKKAIQNSLEKCREIDLKLVKAQEARRVLDRIYGYTLSPLIWKKICYGLSAGRVQSSGLRMLVAREKERMIFKKSEYWDVKANDLTVKGSNIKFGAKLTSYKGDRVASGKDFDGLTGKLKSGSKSKVIDEKEAKKIVEKLKSESFKVSEIKESESTSRPLAPFITSSLQQEGNRKLNMTAKEVMRTAQKLYEEGLITYMRTDSPNLSTEAVNAAREEIEKSYGKEYLSEKPRQFKSKSKQAQEAHEAIRPAGNEFVHPKDTGLSDRELALYELIWKRTMASQMSDAKKASVNAKLVAGDTEFSCSGMKIVFPGFLRVYVEGKDDPSSALDDKEIPLPALKKGDDVKIGDLVPLFHETKPPARFTEASLVGNLEKEEIGRPSTYASIISTIVDRGYVNKLGNTLVPTFTGMAVAQLLEDHFQDLVDYSFTSQMENDLDSIAVGELDSINYLKKFYTGNGGLKKKVENKEKKIKPDESRTVRLPHIDVDTEVKVGRYGPYIISGGKGKEEVHASIPEEIAPADLKSEDIEELIELSKNGPVPMGVHPETGENIYCLMGRYGAYLQLGEKTEENEKPKRSSLPKPLTPKTVTIEQAVQLLSLPRELGIHPEKKEVVTANLGRFGPYVGCDGEFRSLKKDDDLYEITFERALELLAEEKKAPRGSTRIKDFGRHPKTKKSIVLYEGKYGLYLKYGTKNVSLPDDIKNDQKKVDALDTKQVAGIIDDFLKK